MIYDVDTLTNEQLNTIIIEYAKNGKIMECPCQLPTGLQFI